MSEVQQRKDSIVKGGRVVLFMKGTAQFPQCGFSGRAIQVLKASGVKELRTVNVLGDFLLGQLRAVSCILPFALLLWAWHLSRVHGLGRPHFRASLRHSGTSWFVLYIDWMQSARLGHRGRGGRGGLL